MSEGSLEAPERHALAWQDPDFYDEAKLDEELRRVFDICHGCRRCFNLCDSFPRLFDLIDESESGELDSVASADFKPVVDACTLCDMCFMTKCPYVPPHEFNLDFPHLMLRYRAVEHKKGKIPFAARQITKTDRNGEMASHVAGLVNWAGKCGNAVTRPIMESTIGVHREAKLPAFTDVPLVERNDAPKVNESAPAYGRKAVLYATCFANYNNPSIGLAARAILAKNGVETAFVYPRCCGMPQLEQGDIAAVANSAKQTAQDLKPWIEKGYDVIALVPSCALMLKFEWPLIVADDDDVKTLSAHTSDVTEYIVGIAKKEGLADGISALDGGVTIHISCHSRAQNMGQKAAEMLRLIPDIKVNVIERCSGHGGSWGVMKENFEVGLKVGKPVARKAGDAGSKYILSECPLARDHIVQGVEKLGKPTNGIDAMQHPVELVARAYGL